MKDIVHLIECEQYEHVADLGKAHVCSGAVASKESNHGSLHFLEDKERKVQQRKEDRERTSRERKTETEREVQQRKEDRDRERGPAEKGMPNYHTPHHIMH